MGKTVFLGTFDAERFWGDDNYAKLPEISDGSSGNIVASMDELMFPLCESGDILLTRFRMNPVLKGYLNNLGFPFDCNSENLQPEKEQDSSDEKCVFELLSGQFQSRYFRNLLKDKKYFSPYAVLPHTALACRNWGMTDDNPGYEIVKKVNSKIYSHELSDRIGIRKYGKIIRSSGELREEAPDFTGGRRFLIKDPYGVSGRGNILISSQRMLDMIGKYIFSQEEKGMITCFLLEPYLDKRDDFSCQMVIDRFGNCNILSVQKIINNNFSYSGSMSASDCFINFLWDRGYFEVMNKAAVELAKDGYAGNICIDSMILKNDDIVPLVEINARKAMGLINYYLDKFLEGFSSKSYFVFFSLGFENDVRFEDILMELNDRGILFDPSKGTGIIPLSCNTLFINRDMRRTMNTGRMHRGRFYVSIVSHNDIDRLDLDSRCRDTLKSLSFTIYN